MIRIKRAYEPYAREDGARFLIDRLWPRGMSKGKLRFDGWLKDIAPSTRLRQWFRHDPAKWPEFQKRYRAELRSHPDELRVLLDAARYGDVTLLYGAKDGEHNDAMVLRKFMEEKLNHLLKNGGRSRIDNGMKG